MFERTHNTKNLDHVATIKTVSGIEPNQTLDAQGMVIFSFPLTSEVVRAIVEYETGALLVDAKTLLSNRNRLYKQIREVA